MTSPFEVAIERLVPHRGPSCWIRRLLEADAESVVVEAIPTREHPLADNEGVPSFAGIEYMAQAIAAWAGCRALQRGVETRPGFLLGTRRFEAQRAMFDFDRALRIEARCELFGENGLGMFACRILQGDAIVASAHVSVFEPPDAAAFLESSSA